MLTVLSLLLVALLPPCRSDPYHLSQLPEGKHMGMIIGFDAYSPANLQRVQARINDLEEDGMQVRRVQLDWIDLEPSPQVYDIEPLEEALDSADGNPVFVLLAAVDSEGDTVILPPDLRSTSFSGLVDRFKQLLDFILPTIRAHRVFLLSVGNEPDAYLEDNPTELMPMADFVDQARQHVHQTDPDLPVSITLANVFPELAAVSDVVVFNWYSLNPDLSVSSIDAFVQGFDDREAIIGDKPYVVQEAGVPAGFDPSTNGGSPELQRELVEVLVEQLKTRPNFRVAFWFTLVDWSVSTTELLSSTFEDSVDPAFVTRFEEWLRTGGLLYYEQDGQSDMSPRPAWEAFRAGLRELSGASEPECRIFRSLGCK